MLEWAGYGSRPFPLLSLIKHNKLPCSARIKDTAGPIPRGRRAPQTTANVRESDHYSADASEISLKFPRRPNCLMNRNQLQPTVIFGAMASRHSQLPLTHALIWPTHARFRSKVREAAGGDQITFRRKQ